MVSSKASFWEHFDALRKVVLSSLALVLVVSCVLFAIMPWIFEHVILAPCDAKFPLYRLVDRLSGDGGVSDFHVRLINVRLASQFFVHLSSSLWLSVVLCVPVILCMLWRFVSPGLYYNERVGGVKALVWGCVMFYIGVFVGYILVFPLTLRFLSEYQLSPQIGNIISLDSYMDNFLMLTLVMGLVFELPVVAWLLGRIGIVSRGFFRIYRRHAVVCLLLLSAIVTPTGDAFTLFVVFMPLYLLWECSALCVPNADHGAIRLSSE